MFYLRLHIIVTLLLLINVIVIKAQSSVYDQNKNYLDSVEFSQKLNFCNKVISYPDRYSKKEVNIDASVIYLLNDISQDSYTETALNISVKRQKKIRISKVEKYNGLIKVIEVIINGRNLRAEATIESINGFIYRKFFSLSTNTNGRCGSSAFRILDFKLLRNFYLGKIDFLINYSYNTLTWVNLNINQLEVSEKKYVDYKFNIPKAQDKDNWLQVIFSNQYNSDSSCCYSYIKGNKTFIELIKAERIDLIKDMLYSPNYFYAVNAMEAIIYLSSINKITLDEPMRKKIESIKKGTYPITIRKTEDLFTTVNGYNEINTSDNAVIKKYRD